YRLAESYEIWAPANLIYRPGEQTVKIGGEAINQDTLAAMLTRQSYGKTMRRVDVKIDFKNMLVLNLPAGGSCLHVMEAQRAEIPENSDAQVLMIYPFSRPDLILSHAEGKQPPQAIFGAEPEHNWCYYYQKASLARQNDDWKTISTLGDEVLKLGLNPADASEWMPFYEAYAREKRFDEANLLGGYLRDAPYFINMYCIQFKTDELSSNILNAENRFINENLCPDLLNKE
ncbi:MAG: hypothetical protein LWX83_10275, partial [Anaerolineae bacterium]|nr:hypothetical protein [Anaerolineae bacterium]